MKTAADHVMELLKKQGTLTSRELCDALSGYSCNTVRRALGDLAHENKIKRSSIGRNNPSWKLTDGSEIVVVDFTKKRSRPSFEEPSLPKPRTAITHHFTF